MEDMKIKFYCINLAYREDRWKRFQSSIGYQIIKKKHHIERYDAVVGKDIDIENDSRISLRSRRNILDHQRRDHEEICSKGAVGCYLSHYEVWKKFIESDLEEWLCVFEDDADLPDMLLGNLESVLREMKTEDRGDCLFMSPPNSYYFWPKGKTAPQNDSSASMGDWIKGSCSTGTGYVLNRHACKVLIDHALPIESHVDLYMCMMSQLGKIRTVYNKRTTVNQTPVKESDTDIQTDRCELCDVPVDFKNRGYKVVNMRYVYFAAATLAVLYGLSLYSKRGRKGL